MILDGDGEPGFFSSGDVWFHLLKKGTDGNPSLLPAGFRRAGAAAKNDFGAELLGDGHLRLQSKGP